MEKITFKERVKNIAISEAKKYKKIYVDYEYLVCSSAMELKDYYIVDAKEDNYQHLIGVNSAIKPQIFFEKCFNGTLEEDDFDFFKRGQSEKSVIGSVRRKINVLADMMSLFDNSRGFKVEETFSKNRVICSFATSDNKCTLGFIDNKKARPKTLLKGNELDVKKMKDVDLVLRKETGKGKFTEVIIGNDEMIRKYYAKIADHIEVVLIPQDLYNNEVIYKEIANDLEEKQ